MGLNANKEVGLGKGIWEEFVRTWLPAIVVVLIIRTFVFEPFRIPSGSMIPTLAIGDNVVVTKFSYGVWAPFIQKELFDLGDPERGDVIVFKYPRNTKLNYIKRVVAIGGDLVSVEDNQVFINGVPQAHTYVDRIEYFTDRCQSRPAREYRVQVGDMSHTALTNAGMLGSLSDMTERLVPHGHVFVMGDNRDNSEDSRRWGFVPFDMIKGKAQTVWMSWDRCSGRVGGFRTDRFFHSLYGDEE